MKLHHLFRIIALLSIFYLNAQTTNTPKTDTENNNTETNTTQNNTSKPAKYKSNSQVASNKDALSDSISLDQKFEYIIKNSSNYQTFKVVPRTWLYMLKTESQDSLNSLKKQLKEAQLNTKKIKDSISKLKLKLNKNNSQTNSNSVSGSDTITIFGLEINKYLYSSVVWTIILALLILLGIFVYKFKNSNTVTNITKTKLSDLEEEHEEFRRQALEREQKVRRQLQDEINKNKSK